MPGLGYADANYLVLNVDTKAENNLVTCYFMHLVKVDL